ncbi:hypothetical protein IED13_25400 [Bosea sp. SSUT16]|jgi:hypothetical protein|uniref:Uncharacterized protein n=1 Tax=Bosea spartocytisi TaxID=2773451 RepID=A0A927EG25_9HYPH|nr:hypothetical protein [Bosea spartocytisi]MBD3849049.1 hypothetical protein [Bosea spartocytisi]MCT4474332.1 hypothetical protein [Bosea spartocytisi]
MNLQAEIARIERRQAEVRAFVDERCALSRAVLERVPHMHHGSPPWVFAAGGVLAAILLIGYGALLAKLAT